MIRMLYGGRERALCAALRIYSHGIYNVQITRRHLLPSLTQKLAYIVIAIANTIILHEITTACMCSCTMQDLRYSSHIVPEQKHLATAATIIGWVAGTSTTKQDDCGRIFGSFRSFCLFFLENALHRKLCSAFRHSRYVRSLVRLFMVDISQNMRFSNEYMNMMLTCERDANNE